MRNQLFIILAAVVLIFTACGKNKNSNNEEAGASDQLKLSENKLPIPILLSAYRWRKICRTKYQREEWWHCQRMDKRLSIHSHQVL